MVKVVAAGDALPTGETVREVTGYALNNAGQVAFTSSLQGAYLATPVVPAITRVRVKEGTKGLQLQVDGTGFITNDTVIEVDGVALDAMQYPEGAREVGGTTRRVRGKDARLGELIGPGQEVQVSVVNPLTGQRSAPVAYVRP
jgi:hypothetical protein